MKIASLTSYLKCFLDRFGDSVLALEPYVDYASFSEEGLMECAVSLN